MALGEEYTIFFEGVAVTAAQDLFEIVAAAAKPLEVIEAELSQGTELGDAAEEQLQLRWRIGNTVSGSGGTAPTPVKHNPSSAAASLTAEANNTTKANTGTTTTLRPTYWNIRTEKVHIPLPETRFVIAGGQRACLELVAAPADSITMSGYVIVREIG